MSEHKLLPVRLRHTPDEHFSAYLLRLALANGRSSVRELLKTVGLKGVNVSKHQAHDTLAALARHLGLEQKELSASISRAEMLRHIPALDDSRIYRSLELSYPRICVACIRSGGLIPAYTGQLPFTHCLDHGHELIHSCPACHTLFEWSEELFECLCTACSATIEQIDTTPVLPSYAYELIVRQADSSSLNKYIGDLLLAVQRIFEPFSSSLIIRERPPSEVLNWTSVLSQAYSLLDSAETIGAWIETCARTRSITASIGTAAVYLPIDTLRAKLSLRWRLREADCHSAATVQVMDTYRADTIAHLAPVDHMSLSKVLGCKPSEILPLLETGAIECVKAHMSVRDARFDLTGLARQVELLSDEQTDELIGIERSARIASAHGGHLGNVMAGILLGKIPFKLKHDRATLLDGALVGHNGLLAYMAKHFTSLESTQFTLIETIAITGLTEREITQACTLRLIKPLGWRSSFFFLGRDIGCLLSTHTSVRRWSKMSGVSTSKLQQGLSGQQFPAAIDGVLYKRNASLDAWLDLFANC